MKKSLLSAAILIVVVVAILFYRATSVFENNQYQVTPVSNTYLTLPTIYTV